MNWYSIFYWLTVADNARYFFWTFAVIFTVIGFFATIAVLNSDSNTSEAELTNSRKWFAWSYSLGILFWIGVVFTPNKKDSLLIIAGGGTLQYLTTDSSAKQIPHELTNFVLTELKSMSKDVELEMDLKSQKEKVLETAKKMTTEELLQKIQVDTNFANIVLERK